MTLEEHRDNLAICRFCPMCKPAGEVGAILPSESNTTRGRALLVWRLLDGRAAWTPRTSEILFETTLDGIAQAWCVGHLDVPGYLRAARAAAWDAEAVPAPVRDALDPIPTLRIHGSGDTLLVGGELSEAGDEHELARLAAFLGDGVAWAVGPTGRLADDLGRRELAIAQRRDLTDAIRAGGYRRLVADGPRTWSVLRALATGVDAPPALEGVSIVSLAQAIEHAAVNPAISLDGAMVLVHDSRAASDVADELAVSEAVLPGFSGLESALGQGEAFEGPRRVVRSAGGTPAFDRWSRSLARSCGADDGLWRTYPAVAGKLAEARVDEAVARGVDTIIADSPLCARWLRQHAGGRVRVVWLPDLVHAPLPA